MTIKTMDLVVPSETYNFTQFNGPAGPFDIGVVVSTFADNGVSVFWTGTQAIASAVADVTGEGLKAEHADLAVVGLADGYVAKQFQAAALSAVKQSLFEGDPQATQGTQENPFDIPVTDEYGNPFDIAVTDEYGNPVDLTEADPKELSIQIARSMFGIPDDVPLTALEHEDGTIEVQMDTQQAQEHLNALKEAA